MVRDLKAQIPDSEIVFFVSNTNKALLSVLECADRAEVLQIYSPLVAIRQMRASHCDVLIDCSQWPRISALLIALAGAKWTIGFRTPRQKRHFAFDAIIDHRGDRHEIDNYRALASALGVSASSLPSIKITTQHRSEAASFNLENYIVLHPWPAGFKSELKCWPSRNWIAVANDITARGINVVFTGGRADQEAGLNLVEQLRPNKLVHDLTGRLTLGGTAAVLESALAVISVNTGIMHLAAALKPSLIALNGPTNPRRWGPVSETAISLVPDCPNCGYLSLGFEYPDDPPDCMGAISVAAVLQSLRHFLPTERDALSV